MRERGERFVRGRRIAVRFCDVQEETVVGFVGFAADDGVLPCFSCTIQKAEIDVRGSEHGESEGRDVRKTPAKIGSRRIDSFVNASNFSGDAPGISARSGESRYMFTRLVIAKP